MIFDKADPEQAGIIELRESNGRRLATLAAQGVQIQVNRANAVLEFLLDTIAGDSPARLEFERNDALGIADQLDQVETELRKMRLSQGVAGDPRVVQQIAQHRR